MLVLEKKRDGLVRCFVWYLFFTFIVLFFVYSPALTVDFAQNDDYYYFTYDNRSSFSYHPQYDFFNLVGREVYNIIALPMAMLIRDMSGFSVVRYIVVFILSFSISLMGVFLEKNGVKRTSALFVGLLLAVLPGFQAGVMWVTMSPFFVSLLLSITAGILLNSFNYTKALPIGQMTKVIAAPIALLIASLFIYQPWAMSFLWVFACILLFSKQITIREIIVRTSTNFTVFCLSCITYYLLHKYIILDLLFYFKPELISNFESLGQFKFSLSGNPFDRLTDLLINQSKQVFGIWYVNQGSWIFVAILTFIVLLIINSLVENYSNNNYKRIILQWVLYVFVFFAALSPFALSVGGHSGFRVLLPAVGLLALLIGKSIDVIISHRYASNGLLPDNKLHTVLVYIVPISFLILICLSAYSNVKGSVRNTIDELLFIQSKIFDYVANNGAPTRIHYILPLENVSFSGEPTQGNGELFYNSTSSWPNVPWITRAAMFPLYRDKKKLMIFPTRLENLNQSIPKNAIQVTWSNNIGNISPETNTLIIDMNSLMYNKLREKLQSSGQSLLGYDPISSNAAETGTTHPSSKAFDGSIAPDDFWEVTINKPAELEIWFNDNAAILQSYEIVAGESAERMPTDWILLASVDKRDWTVIDDVKGFKDWVSNTTRCFEAKRRDKKFNYYKFVFKKALDPNILRIYEIKFNRYD